MRLSDAIVEKLLRDAGKLPDDLLSSLKAEEAKTGRALQDLVVKQEIISDEDLIKLYADEVGTPFILLDLKSLTRDVVAVLPERIARQYNAVVFKIDDNGMHHVATSDPDDVQAIDFLKKSLQNKVIFYITTDAMILAALDIYRANIADELDEVIEIQQEEKPQEEKVSAADVAEDSPIAQTVNLILEYAIKSDASDIHIEPREDHVSIRYRIDGVLNEANKLPKNIHGALVSRIKILSNLKIDERRAPQDGRFKITLNRRQYGFRVSTLPITTGEKVVMRILNETGKALTLEQLGYWGKAYRDIHEAIIQPHGMILVTGPTGSGKSTSLFSILSMLNDPKVNISTIEDPVEYKIVGANQTQVNPLAGMTFAAGLRALLRQDPNIIMVGEIRDGETANLGVQAALTGHLVFSTLHTNNAATCLPRLLDMGIEPFLIASTVRGVVGQRLVRTLCKVCRIQYTPEAAELKEIARLFGIDTPDKLERIHELDEEAAEANIGGSLSEMPIGSDESTILKLWKDNKEGCDECKHTGFKGRMGIYEVLTNSLKVQKLIASNGTSNDIQEAAIQEGMVTMQMDGLIKALRGLTSIEEILRVTRE